MGVPRLIFVTGKGGVGKTTISAALALGAAAEGLRVLIVELAADRGLAALFGKHSLHTEPTLLADGLHAVRVETRPLLEAYFGRLLRVPFLTNRLLESSSFQAVAMAAPGVTEFLVLERLLEWVEAGGSGRRRGHDLIVVDAPATGHAIRLLRTPLQFSRMVSGGPIGNSARRQLELLADHERTCAVLVSLPDEMAVNETLEAHEALSGDLGLRMAPPVLNRVFPRRFTAAEARQILEYCPQRPADPLLQAAALQVRMRQDSDRHLRRLQRTFRRTPVCVRQLCEDRLEPPALERIGRELSRELATETP